MKLPIIAVLAGLSTGCTNYTQSDVFRTGNVNYEKVNSNNQAPRAETRVFIKNGSVCDYASTRAESAFGVEIGMLLVKQGLDYLAEYMKAKADYLSSDVILNGKSSLAIEGIQPYWPQEESVVAISKEKEGVLTTSRNQAISLYASENNVDKRKKLIDDFVAAKEEKFYAERTKTVQLSTSAQDLCVLVIAGSYGAKHDGAEIERQFAAANGANIAKLNQYAASTPTIRKEEDAKPFEGLLSDPTLVIELHLVATEKTKTVQYTIVPTNLFYPYPLHRGTVDKLQRKLTLTVKLGDLPVSIVWDHLVSGSPYPSAIMAKTQNQLETDKDRRFQNIEITIAEGPDKAPTAKALREAADKEDLAYKAIERNAVKLWGSDEQKDALKKK